MRGSHEVAQHSDSYEHGGMEGDADAMRPSGVYPLDFGMRDAYRLRNHEVTEVMSRALFAVAPTWRVSDVRRIAEWCGIDHVVVVPSSRLRSANDGGGMPRDLSSGDVLGMLSHHDLDEAHPDTPVASVMSQPVVAVDSAVSLELAANVMRSRGIGALPVVEEGRIAGMVTHDDLFRAGELEHDLEPCASCGGRRQLQVDYRGRGVTLCRDCADRSVESLPYAETGAGD